MALGLMGLKVGCTQVYNGNGDLVPVTVLQVGPCPVLQVRNQERDGYDAVQIGFLEKPQRLASRSERGHVRSDLESKRRRAQKAAGATAVPKANCEPPRHLREFRLTEPAQQQVGDVLKIGDIFNGIKAVDVIGTSKGKGYQGVMKRHNFGGLPATHGAKQVHRSIGSIGSLASNRGGGRPKKGRKMAGHLGTDRITVRNLEVVQLDADNNMLLVYGAVPGPKGGLVLIRPTNKNKNRKPVTK